MKFYRSILQAKDKKRAKRNKLAKSNPIFGNYSYSTHLSSNLSKSAELLESIQNTSTEKSNNAEVQKSMLSIQQILSQPKEINLQQRAEGLEEELTDPVSHQALRDNRWSNDTFCPYCNSKSIVQLSTDLQESAYNFKYKCLDCESRFDDDTGTNIETGVPPINVWMQCWYLLGCTNKIELIAEKLNLDLRIVEEMIAALQKSFKSKQPTVSQSKQNSWAQHKELFKKKIAQVVAEKKNELYGGAIVNQARDTAEERKQKQRKVTSFIHKNRKF